MSFSALFPSHFVVESLRAVTVNPERSTVCADTLLFMTAPSRPITIIGVEEKASVKFTLASTVEEAFTLTLPRFINIFLFANLSSCELVLSKLVLYRDWKQMPVIPLTNASCISCGLCAARCPVQAIPVSNPSSTDQARCILCMRCISVCPVKARSLPEQACAMLEQKLSPVRDIRRENELFL